MFEGILTPKNALTGLNNIPRPSKLTLVAHGSNKLIIPLNDPSMVELYPNGLLVCTRGVTHHALLVCIYATFTHGQVHALGTCAAPTPPTSGRPPASSKTRAGNSWSRLLAHDTSRPRGGTTTCQHRACHAQHTPPPDEDCPGARQRHSLGTLASTSRI